MTFAINQISFEPEGASYEKYVRFTLKNQRYSAALYYIEEDKKWIVRGVLHQGDTAAKEECLICQKKFNVRDTLCHGFKKEGRNQLYEDLINHPTFRLKALFELGYEQDWGS